MVSIEPGNREGPPVNLTESRDIVVIGAYSVMAVTILIDIYLLFIFFTVQQAASRRSQRYGLC
jgi:hypothetical protein